MSINPKEGPSAKDDSEMINEEFLKDIMNDLKVDPESIDGKEIMEDFNKKNKDGKNDDKNKKPDDKKMDEEHK